MTSDLDEIIRKYYEREATYEKEHKGTWTECRVQYQQHRGEVSEYGWCEAHRYPSDRCNIVLNGDSYICRYHNRSWKSGICPGLRGPLG